MATSGDFLEPEQCCIATPVSYKIGNVLCSRQNRLSVIILIRKLLLSRKIGDKGLIKCFGCVN